MTTTRRFTGESFESRHLEHSQAAGIEFVRCEFIACSVGSPWQQGSVVRDVHLTRCKAISCCIGEVDLWDCSFTSLSTAQWSRFEGTWFQRVRFLGQNQRVLVFPGANDPRWGDRPALNRQRYETADWAIDIRGASFSELDIRGIPIAKVLADDNEWQVRVDGAKAAASSAWRTGMLKGTATAVGIEMALARGDDGVVIAGPRSGASGEKLRAEIAELRRLHLTL